MDTPGQYDTEIPAERMAGDSVRFGRPDELTQAEMAEIDAANQGQQVPGDDVADPSIELIEKL
ncbi:MAG: hypothetical protein IIB78_10390 [Proteobacteria bacterium]|nr:hypothetical protein [Pseudomonadota bacterium]